LAAEGKGVPTKAGSCSKGAGDGVGLEDCGDVGAGLDITAGDGVATTWESQADRAVLTINSITSKITASLVVL